MDYPYLNTVMRDPRWLSARLTVLCNENNHFNCTLKGDTETLVSTTGATSIEFAMIAIERACKEMIEGEE